MTTGTEPDRPKSSPTPAPGRNTASLQLLKYAWERHDVYSNNATNAQKRFFFIRRVLAYLGVAVVVLSVVQPIIRDQVDETILERVSIAEERQVVTESSQIAPLEATADATPVPTDVSSTPEATTNDESISEVAPVEENGNFLNRAGGLSIGALLRLSLQDPISWIAALTLVDFLLILLPILTTALIAFAVKFDRGNNWVLLRGNSETLKMEIFYYRTKVKQYKHNRNAVLAEKLKMISERVKGSAVHQAALDPYENQRPTRLKKGIVIVAIERVIQAVKHVFVLLWEKLFQVKEEPIPTSETKDAAGQQQEASPKAPDRAKPGSAQQAMVGSPYQDQDKIVAEKSKEEELQGQDTVDTSDRVKEATPQEKKDYAKRYQDLDAGSYIRYRLEDQFDWYRRKAQNYDRNYQRLQTSVYVFGGLGTLLAAIGLQNWVAVSTTVAGAFAGYLEYKRVEATLVGYNQAADALYDIRAWWYALSKEERKRPENFEKLVASTEETIRSEHTSWLQDMQDRLANLYGDAGEEEAAEDIAPETPEPETAPAMPTVHTEGGDSPDPVPQG